MMTGQILGGSNPLTAIKYQFLIMIAIFTGSVITVAVTLKIAQTMQNKL
jgi:putative ABC transport system permease protein